MQAVGVFFGVIVALAVIIIGYFISTQRSLVSLDEMCKNALSQIEVQLNSRFDAVVALAKTAAQYAKDESETSCVFRPSSGNGIVDANRAYLVLPIDADSKDYLIVFDDDPTGINAINGSLQRGGDKTVYDLQGRKIAGTPSSKKGVYIVGGKKIVIK